MKQVVEMCIRDSDKCAREDTDHILQEAGATVINGYIRAGPFVRNRQACEGASKVRHGGNQLGKLTNERSLMPEAQDSLSLYLERLRIHLLFVESYEPSVDLVSLDRGEHPAFPWQ